MKPITQQYCPICKKNTPVAALRRLKDRIHDRLVTMLWIKCRECHEWIAPDGRQFL